jgi:hypothetical protein
MLLDAIAETAGSCCRSRQRHAPAPQVALPRRVARGLLRRIRPGEDRLLDALVAVAAAGRASRSDGHHKVVFATPIQRRVPGHRVNATTSVERRCS